MEHGSIVIAKGVHWYISGVGALLLFIGMAIGPAIAGAYMENHETVEGVEGSYPYLDRTSSVPHGRIAVSTLNRICVDANEKKKKKSSVSRN
jgi:hypothetical protein